MSWTKRVMAATALLAALGIAAAEEEQQAQKCEAKAKPAGRHGPAMRPNMENMRGMFHSLKTFRALRSVAPDLDETQRAKFTEAMQKMMDKIKKVQQEFETDLGDILTYNQMKRFLEAKEAMPDFGKMARGRGRFGPGRGRFGARGDGEAKQ